MQQRKSRVSPRAAGKPAMLIIVNAWQVRVIAQKAAPDKKISATVVVPPPDFFTVKGERYAGLPVFNPQTCAGWRKGIALQGVRAQECTTRHALDPASLEVRAGPRADAQLFAPGKDYEADLDWGTVGRLAGGRISEKQSVFISYRYAKPRIDSIVLTSRGRLALRKGKPAIAVPRPPRLRDNETRLANVWIPGRLARLTPDNLFPILETEYPESSAPFPAAAEHLLPNTLRKLRHGRRLKIIAWGDSVTAGGFLPNAKTDRWQAQFVSWLKERFPKADIQLITEAWGGRTTDAYLTEPPGSIHNYREKVLAPQPDLIISEFVNDAYLQPDQVAEKYGRLLADFRALGAEWIIMTPHYVHPAWMGLTREREVDNDPRPYVAGLRAFARKHGVALADASRRYGRLWRQGIPCSSLMHNNINHPDARGMKILADSLRALFPCSRPAAGQKQGCDKTGC